MEIANIKKYPKINGLYKRNEKGKITAEICNPLFEFLANNKWHAYEKIDGTNIRIAIYKQNGNINTVIAGRNDNSSIPSLLEQKLKEIIDGVKDWDSVFFRPLKDGDCVVMYGEGYGKGIQSAGNRYNPEATDFILFDVLFNKTWYTYNNLLSVGAKVNIKVVPYMGTFTIPQAENIVKKGFISHVSHDKTLIAEGLVLRPASDAYLFDCLEERITVKIKTKDYI